MSYIAMTIGPIIETISLARKTSEIWAASYLFSYLMKKIVDELRQKDDVTFLIPFTEDEKLFEDEDGGVGKFHDRFILQSDTLTLEEVEAIVEKHKNNLGQMVAKSVGVDENSVRESISEYLQTYILHTRKSLSILFWRSLNFWTVSNFIRRSSDRKKSRYALFFVATWF